MVKWFANFPPIRKALIGSYLARIESYFSEMTRYRDLYYDTQYGDWFERTIDSHDLPETQVGGPRDVIQLRGRTISRTYFDHLVRIWNLGAHVDISRSRSVFEIGGGFGATAHLLLHLYPGVRKFLYLDIPPVLYVGTQYLKHHFGADVIDYATTRDMAEITFSEDDTREILCICPWQLDRVSADIDLFWNSASFQEMEVLMVSNYARQIARLTQGSEDPVLGLWMYVTPNKTRILPAEDVVGGFLDWFEFTELEPAIELGSSRYLVGIRSGNTPS